MKYAIVNGGRSEAEPGLKGICPCCGSETVSRCGEVKVNHWAHKSKRNCDTYWENETDWHREWKSHFPTLWQEVVLEDKETGERHIADVQTDDGFVIEFQYSHINPVEQRSRERYYKRMVWVLNGSRRKNDPKRFAKGFRDFKPTNQKGIFAVPFPDEAFHESWIRSSVPVFFDFDDSKGSIWGLLPGRQNGYAIALCVFKSQLVVLARNGTLFDKLQEIGRYSRI